MRVHPRQSELLERQPRGRDDECRSVALARQATRDVEQRREAEAVAGPEDST